MRPAVVICRKCGYFKGNAYEDPTCPICGEKLLDAGLDFKTFGHMSKEEENAYREEFLKGIELDPHWVKKREEGQRKLEENIIREREEFNRTHAECPYCHKRNTKKISTGSRLLSVGFFGLGSKKVGKQWHCNNCGSDF